MNGPRRGQGVARISVPLPAVDRYSRLAYPEILDSERKGTAAGLWRRADDFFANIGVEVAEVMTDNGSCYRPRAFAKAFGEGAKHRKTKPYRS